MSLPDFPETLRFGISLSQAQTAIILLHGRGASADDISVLADSIEVAHAAFLAPSAAGGSWYPGRFLDPVEQNEPALSAALALVGRLVAEIGAAGVPASRVALIGFSQGGCLALEYAARNPRRYALVAGLSSALVGPLATARSPGDLQQTPCLLGCAENDAHIPLEYVEKSAVELEKLQATVTKQIYPGSTHAIFGPEMAFINSTLGSL